MTRNLATDGPPARFGTLNAPPSAKRPVHHPPVGIFPALQSLAMVLIVSVFIMTFTVQPIRIPSSSMEPTLLVGDFLLLDRQATALADAPWMPPVGIARGDVVVFHDPIDDPSIHLVKRVIGLPGDRLKLRKGVVYLNGQALPEPYAVHRGTERDPYRDDFPNLQTMDSQVDPNWWIRLRHLVQNGELPIPSGSYFVMGDNRNDSADSRYWGFVPRELIVGNPLLVYFSWHSAEKHPAAEQGPTDSARWERIFHIVH